MKPLQYYTSVDYKAMHWQDGMFMGGRQGKVSSTCPWSLSVSSSLGLVRKVRCWVPLRREGYWGPCYPNWHSTHPGRQMEIWKMKKCWTKKVPRQNVTRVLVPADKKQLFSYSLEFAHLVTQKGRKTLAMKFQCLFVFGIDFILFSTLIHCEIMTFLQLIVD